MLAICLRTAARTASDGFVSAFRFGRIVYFLSSEPCIGPLKRLLRHPMVCACQVSVSARLRRRSDRRGKTEHGTPLPLCAVFVLLASAARRLLGVAIALPRGSALSRESLTQDSRSTVKARLIDPLRESFGEGRCAPSRYKR